MDKKISICGLVCSECGAYLATLTDDEELRKKTAAEWSKAYGSDIKPEDVRCAGCTSTEGVVFNYCHVCGIRGCGRKRKVINCAHCSEYPCGMLSGFFAAAPAAKATLDEIRKTLK